MNEESFFSNYIIKKKEFNPTLIQIAGFPRWETVWSNIIAFYLDIGPHGMNGFLLGCLSSILKIDFGEVQLVERESYTDTGNRIDIFIETEKTCFFIENKIGASLYNNLEDYRLFCQKRANNRDVFGIVLSTKSEKVRTPFHNITYEELINQIELSISQIVYNCGNKYFIFFLDFIKNIKTHLEGNMNYDEEFYKLYIDNRDKIKDIVHNYNLLVQYTCRLANEYVKYFDAWAIENKEKIWVWEKNTTVIDMKEKNENLKVAIDLSIHTDKISLSICNRKQGNDEKALLSPICNGILDQLDFNNGRFYANETFTLKESEKIEEVYAPLIHRVITNYNEM